jgi:hypothetical protein
MRKRSSGIQNSSEKFVIDRFWRITSEGNDKLSTTPDFFLPPPGHDTVANDFNSGQQQGTIVTIINLTFFLRPVFQFLDR